jgi:hypothetical protein
VEATAASCNPLIYFGILETSLVLDTLQDTVIIVVVSHINEVDTSKH